MAKEESDFEDISEEVPEQEFADEVPMQPGKTKEVEIMPGDVGGVTFIKTPETGESIILNIEKVVNNPNTTGKNKQTGESFSIGVKKKDNTVIRYDLVTKEGRYTVMNWEIFFKLFGPDGIVAKYGNENGSFKGCKIKITKNYNAKYANWAEKDIAKLLDMSIEKAAEHKKEIADAMQKKKLYTIELVK